MNALIATVATVPAAAPRAADVSSGELGSHVDMWPGCPGATGSRLLPSVRRSTVTGVAVPWTSLAVRAGRLAVQHAPRLLSAAAAAGRAAPAGRFRSTAGARPRSGPPRGRHLAYAPQPDGRADPGEVVWTWVAYEDDRARGKDRPVLVVGRSGRRLHGLMLSSRSERDGAPGWLALGSGPWDREQRPSWVRLDRVLDVPEQGIRREGAVLDRARFDRVAQALRADHGWR